MQKNVSYQKLTRTFQRLSRFSHLSSIASWDWRPNRWRAAGVNTPGALSVRPTTGRAFQPT